MKWETVKLGDYINIQSGFPFASDGFNDKEGIPVIRIRDVVRGFTKTFFKGEYDESNLVNDGDILVGMDGEFNAAKWSSPPALLNQRVCKITSKDKSLLSEKYLIYLLPKKLKEIEDKTAFATVKHLSVKGINNIEFPLPPPHIQEQIADTLDKADALRRKDQELLQKYYQLAQSIFYDMFGDPVRNEKNWDMRPLDYFISKLTAGVSVNSTDEDSSIQKPSVLKTSCVYTGKFRPTETKVIKTDDLLRARINPRKDTIVISRMNTAELVGKSAYVDQDYNNIFLPDRLWMTEKTDNEHSVMWLSYVLSSKKFMENVSSISSGTSGSMKNISKSEFLKLRIIVPPASLQIKFEHLVSNINKILKHLTAIKTNSQMIFDTYSTQVFS